MDKTRVNSKDPSLHRNKDQNLRRNDAPISRPVARPFTHDISYQAPISPSTPSYHGSTNISQKPSGSNDSSNPLQSTSDPKIHSHMSPMTPSYHVNAPAHSRQSKQRCQDPHCQRVLDDARFFKLNLFNTKEKCKVHIKEINELKVMKVNYSKCQKKCQDLEMEMGSVKTQLKIANIGLQKHSERCISLQKKIEGISEENEKSERLAKKLKDDLNKETLSSEQWMKTLDNKNMVLDGELREVKVQLELAISKSEGYKSELQKIEAELKKSNKELAKLKSSEKRLEGILKENEVEMHRSIQKHEGMIEELRREVEMERNAKEKSTKLVDKFRSENLQLQQRIAILSQGMEGFCQQTSQQGPSVQESPFIQNTKRIVPTNAQMDVDRGGAAKIARIDVSEISQRRMRDQDPVDPYPPTTNTTVQIESGSILEANDTSQQHQLSQENADEDDEITVIEVPFSQCRRRRSRLSRDGATEPLTSTPRRYPHQRSQNLNANYYHQNVLPIQLPLVGESEEVLRRYMCQIPERDQNILANQPAQHFSNGLLSPSSSFGFEHNNNQLTTDVINSFTEYMDKYPKLGNDECVQQFLQNNPVYNRDGVSEVLKQTFDQLSLNQAHH